MNTHSYTKSHNAYPRLLKEIPGPPNEIYTRGSLPEADMSCIAIVGTRKASELGLQRAEEISYNLAKNGIGIISGLAYGIDQAAHKGALDAGGKTWAVVAHGLHTIYPKTHRALAEKIIEHGGGIITEYSEGTEALPHHFLARNRIISGLCVATIIIEAPARSGSLRTASDAVDQGREVFVIPADPENKNYAGSFELLRKGARLIRNTEDIFEDMGLQVKKQTETKAQLDTALETAIYNYLKEEVLVTIDNIAEKLQINVHEASAAITDLLLKKSITENRGRYTIKKS